jgi:hypothetical protein
MTTVDDCTVYTQQVQWGTVDQCAVNRYVYEVDECALCNVHVQSIGQID